MVNFNNETVLDRATHQQFSHYSPVRREIVDNLRTTATSQISLQCLASSAVVRYGIQYVDVLPHRVLKFVAWHQSDIGYVIHCVGDLMVKDSDLDSSVTTSELS